MNIAVIVPSLANKGPVLVAKELIDNIDRSLIRNIELFYFDPIEELEMNVPCHRISFQKEEKFEAFDIIHTHGYRPDKYIYKNRRHIKAKVISTIHTNMYEEYKANYNKFAGWLIQCMWLRILKRHDHIVTLTKVMWTHYSRYFKSGMISVIYNGRTQVLTKGILPEDETLIKNLREKYKIIGTVCNISKRKGLHQVIQALPSLQNVVFLIIGDGNEKEELVKLAERLEVRDRCFFLGERLEVTGYFNFFDVFAMCSYSEGVPLALLEAASHGVPAICSDISMLREIFSDNEVVFFSLDDSNSFISAYNKITTEPSFGTRMKEKYLRAYTGEEMASSYLQLYQQLLSGES